jgi:hypothetical protein
MVNDEKISGANGKGKLELAFPERTFSSMLDVALFYADHGWPVFPVNPLNKVPYPGSHGFYDATFDKDHIRSCWRRYPDAMVATATGLHSKTLVVDLDRKQADKDGVATWAKLTAEHGGAPVTLSSTTPSTGQHHIYRYRYGLRCVALDAIAPGVEIKCDGGYIVLPPSLYTGPNRRRYMWNRPLVPLAEPPDWLVALIREHNDRAPPGEPAPCNPSVPYERIVAALSVINPDIERKPWINIGCALYTQLGTRRGLSSGMNGQAGAKRNTTNARWMDNGRALSKANTLTPSVRCSITPTKRNPIGIQHERNLIGRARQQTVATTHANTSWSGRKTLSLARKVGSGKAICYAAQWNC